MNLTANDTENAILFGRAHRDDLLNPQYERQIDLLYSNAKHLNTEPEAALKFANGSEGV